MERVSCWGRGGLQLVGSCALECVDGGLGDGDDLVKTGWAVGLVVANLETVRALCGNAFVFQDNLHFFA